MNYKIRIHPLIYSFILLCNETTTGLYQVTYDLCVAYFLLS